jgi:hypothetical protein
MTQTPRESQDPRAGGPEHENDNGRDQEREAIRGEQGTSEGDPQNDADPIDPG